MIKTLLTTGVALSLLTVPFLALSAGKVYMKCGEFVFSVSGKNEGFPRINGIKPETQKFTFLKQPEDYNNVKIQWTLPTNQRGRWLGMEFIKRDGKSILNVEVLRATMNGPRTFGTYDCVKVK